MFLSYAQNFEDVMLWRALGKLARGFYIDVGAYDSTEHSVTKAFYTRGWRGLNVEPVQSLFDKLAIERPEDINLHVAVGSGKSTIDFHEVLNSGLSTLRPDVAELQRAAGLEVRVRRIETETLSSICESYARDAIHFLKIDVEGGERDVLLGMDFNRWRPWILLIEATRPNSQDLNYSEWEDLVVQSGYVFAYWDGLNRFYVAQEHAELLPSFQHPPNVFDGFALSPQHWAFPLGQEAAARVAQAERALTELGALKAALQESQKQAEALLATASAREIEAKAETLRAQEMVAAAEANAAAAAASATVAEARAAASTERAEAEAARARLRAAAAEDELLQARADLHLVERRAQQAVRRLQERDSLLEATYRSHSWRVTAPLRALGNTVRRRRIRNHRLRPRLLARPGTPTLFIECTHTYHSDLNTGIQRVVRNVLRNAAESAARYGYAVVPVVLDSNQFVAADLGRVLADKSRAASDAPAASANISFDFRGFGQSLWRLLLRILAAVLPFAPAQRFLFASPDQFGLAWCVLLPLRALRLRPWPKRRPEPDGPITLDQYASCDGSILLLLDSSWPFPIWPAVERFRRREGKVIGVIYDLIPITHPHTCVPNLTIAFSAWLREHARHTEAFIGISRSTADYVAQFMATLPDGRGAPIHPPAIDYFHLGSEPELDLAEREDKPRPGIKRIFDAKRHVFLMVGSFEPRKNHSYVLDAFDRHWAQGGDAALVMIGRHGWKTEDFLARVADHPQFDRRLYLVRDATDSELDYAYCTASALIIASEIEGFGLPVAEAFQRGLPVLCSDIPVFREIAEGKATFFDLSQSCHLTDALMEFCRSRDVEQRGARSQQSWITWRQSTDQLFAAIMRALAGETAPAASPAGT